MHSLYFAFILLTFSYIGCVHNVGVQRGVYSNWHEKYLHNDFIEKENYAKKTSEVNTRFYKRDVDSNKLNATDVSVEQEGLKSGSKKRVLTNFDLASVTDLKPTEANQTISVVQNSTQATEADIFNPGATKRGAFVFGGLTLCAFIYLTYKLYRNKKSKSEGSNTFQTEAPQFRYGVLKSDDNMELSNLPLNMESEDEEDDLQLFDLEQSKREISISNVRLFSDDNDGKSDIEVLNLDLPLPGDRGPSDDRSHLLLDIDDEMANPLLSIPSSSSKT